MTKLGMLFPGQGAQYVGMGKDFYDTFSEAKEVFQHADDLLDMRLSKLIFEGPADELSLTKNCQVAIFVTSYALWKTLTTQIGECTPCAVAGLSLGEYTALTAVGALSFEDAVQLVRKRGVLMHTASVKNPGSMSVVLGMDETRVEEVIAPLRPTHSVWVANLNCPGQVVLSGAKAALAKAAEVLKEAGAKRVLPLDVSGAFHSGFMAEAKEFLMEPLEKVAFSVPSCPIAMNVPGAFVERPEEIQDYLIKQVVSPVYWEKGIRAMESFGIDQFLEFGPGKTLGGMNKRIGTAAPTYSFCTVEDIHTVGGALGAAR